MVADQQDVFEYEHNYKDLAHLKKKKKILPEFIPDWKNYYSMTVFVKVFVWQLVSPFYPDDLIDT